MSTVLEVDGLNVTIESEAGEFRPVRDLSFNLNRGERLAIVGESGSGKSLTLRALMGLLPKHVVPSGRICYDEDRELLSMNERELIGIRGREIGMIFQDPGAALNPVQRVGSQVIEAARISGLRGRKELRDRSEDLLRSAGLAEIPRVMNSYPHQLSGGMKQRVMIAIAMACDPKIILCDEPTTALDVTIQDEILKTLLRRCEELETALILVTHDLAVAHEVSTDVLIMYGGQEMERGPIERVFEDPRHVYTGALVSAVPDVRGQRRRLVSIPGDPAGAGTIPGGCPFHPRCQLSEPRCGETLPSAADLGDGHRAACIHAGNGRPLVELLSQRAASQSAGVNRDGLAVAVTAGAAPGSAVAAAQPPVARSALLDIQDLEVRFRARHGGHTQAVDGIDLTIGHGEMFGLVGESGSGKSTVARCIVGLQPPTAGAISFRGRVMGAQRRSEDDRRAIQMVFQDPYGSLNPALTFRDVLAELLRRHQIVAGNKVNERCAELFSNVGLSSDLLDRYPRSLSGGQRQRASIARALAVEPKVLIADEVTSALDVSVQASVLNLLLDLRDQLNLTMLFISHDLAVVRQVCDRVAVMHSGKIVEQADSDELFANPTDPYTQKLLSAVPSLEA